MTLLALTFLLIAAPAFADQPAPGDAPQEFVDPGILKARADALRDCVADTRVSDISVKSQAYGFFDKLPEERLVVASGNYRRMEREPVAGKVGSIEGMQEAADRRIAEWKRTHREPPPPEITATIAEARALSASKRLTYDTRDELSANQMGLFQYMRNSVSGGVVKLNEHMKLLGVLVGDAFTYATVAHEAQHSRDHAAGTLTPEAEIAGEVNAFKTQYLWLKLMDPTGERMLTLHGSLKMWARRETDDKVRIALNEAVTYLEHLSDVVETNGDKAELEKLVKKLGYADEHDHDGNKNRGAASPTSA